MRCISDITFTLSILYCHSLYNSFRKIIMNIGRGQNYLLGCLTGPETDMMSIVTRDRYNTRLDQGLI